MAEPQAKKARMVQGGRGPCVWWARNDLRMEDNPVIRLVMGAAHTDRRPFLGVFVFDPRFLDRSPYGRVTDPEFKKSITMRKPITFSSRKTGPLRARFWIRCVLALRKEMEAQGTKLLVCHGKPEDVLAGLPTGSEVKCQSEPVSIEQTDVEKFVSAALINKGSKLRTDPGAISMYHPHDLPFRVNERPENYSAMGWALGWNDIWTSTERREGAAPIRPCVPVPAAIPPLPEEMPTLPGQIPDDILADEIKMLKHLGYSEDEIKEATACEVDQGGAHAAKQHLEEWAARQTKEASVGALEGDAAVYWDLPCAGQSGPAKEHDPFQWLNLSKQSGGFRLSHYLAVGCISPRMIFHRGAETPNFAMVAHRLLWRDFHRLYAIKYHRKIAWLQGPARVKRGWKDDAEIADAWKKGKTGVPYIDACQRELQQTGWLAYKGRKTAAHFLVFDLWMDWRIGAFHDEETLMDYDFAMNYGNWAVVSKIGNGGGSAWAGSVDFDPEFTNIRSKLGAEEKNDPTGAYIRKWVPELAKVEDKHIHTPWTMSTEEQGAVGCVLGKDYPQSLVGSLELAGCEPGDKEPSAVA